MSWLSIPSFYWSPSLKKSPATPRQTRPAKHGFWYWFPGFWSTGFNLTGDFGVCVLRYGQLPGCLGSDQLPLPVCKVMSSCGAHRVWHVARQFICPSWGLGMHLWKKVNRWKALRWLQLFTLRRFTICTVIKCSDEIFTNIIWEMASCP